MKQKLYSIEEASKKIDKVIMEASKKLSNNLKTTLNFHYKNFSIIKTKEKNKYKNITYFFG